MTEQEEYEALSGRREYQALMAKRQSPAAPKEEKKRRSFTDYVTETAENFPGSFKKSMSAYGDFANEVVDKGPFDAIVPPAVDLLQGGITHLSEDYPPEYQRQHDMATQVGDQLKKRHWGDENTSALDANLDTLRTDPFGMLETATMLGGNVPGAIGKASRMADPINAALKLAGSPQKALLKRGAMKNMEAATQFSGNKMDPRVLSKAMLDDGLTVSRGGLSRLDDILSKLNERRTSILDKADRTGWSASPLDIVSPLEPLRAKHSGMGATNQRKALRDIDKIEAEYLYGKGGRRIAPSEYSTNKTNWDSDIYQSNRVGKPPIDSTYGIEAKQAMADTARAQLADVAPGIDKVNAELGPLIELKPELTKKVYGAENAPLIPMDSPLRMLVGSQLGGKAGAIIGGLSGQLGKAGPQSTLALGMQGGAKTMELLEMVFGSELPLILRETQRRQAEEEGGLL